MILSEGNLSNLIDFVYLNLIKNSRNINYFIRNAILIPKNINIDKIFDVIMKRFSDEVYLYPNADLMNLAKNISTK